MKQEYISFWQNTLNHSQNNERKNELMIELGRYNQNQR